MSGVCSDILLIIYTQTFITTKHSPSLMLWGIGCHIRTVISYFPNVVIVKENVFFLNA